MDKGMFIQELVSEQVKSVLVRRSDQEPEDCVKALKKVKKDIVQNAIDMAQWAENERVPGGKRKVNEPDPAFEQYVKDFLGLTIMQRENVLTQVFEGKVEKPSDHEKAFRLACDKWPMRVKRVMDD